MNLLNSVTGMLLQDRQPEFLDSDSDEPLSPPTLTAESNTCPCSGCGDFSCVLGWKGVPVNILEWAKGHDLLWCGHEGVPHLQRRTSLLPAKCGECRKASFGLLPFSGSKKTCPHSLKNIFSVLFCFCARVPLSSVADSAESTVRRATDWVENLLHFCQMMMESSKAERAQVDETFFGARRAHKGPNKGKAARRRKYWALSATEVTEDGKSFHIFCKVVHMRSAPAVTDFILKRVTSQVTTDSFKSYASIKKLLEHNTVNHAMEWVSASGVHTNNAESTHSVIKRALRATYRRCAADFLSLQRQLDAICGIINVEREGEKEAKVEGGARWRHRLIYLLRFVSRHRAYFCELQLSKPPLAVRKERMREQSRGRSRRNEGGGGDAPAPATAAPLDIDVDLGVDPKFNEGYEDILEEEEGSVETLLSTIHSCETLPNEALEFIILEMCSAHFYNEVNKAEALEELEEKARKGRKKGKGASAKRVKKYKPRGYFPVVDGEPVLFDLEDELGYGDTCAIEGAIIQPLWWNGFLTLLEARNDDLVVWTSANRPVQATKLEGTARRIFRHLRDRAPINFYCEPMITTSGNKTLGPYLAIEHLGTQLLDIPRERCPTNRDQAANFIKYVSSEKRKSASASYAPSDGGEESQSPPPKTPLSLINRLFPRGDSGEE